MKIIVDLMGGDYAPIEIVKGALEFLNHNFDASLILVGTEHPCCSLIKEYGLDEDRFRFVPATQVIGMSEHPAKALKDKTDSSIAVGFRLLQSGEGDALISAGNTGAMLVGTSFTIKSIEGVIRPTIGALVPKEDGTLGFILDVGLNSDCKPEFLNHFAILGSLYVKSVLGIPNPKVALLNIGEEEGKGDILSQASYPLLKANKMINFIGNIEGRDLIFSKADVVVCGGFVGNIVLKTMESFHLCALKRNIKDSYFGRFDFELYGGTPILGANKPVIIGHGISTAKAVKNMIIQAKTILEGDLIGKIKSSFTQVF